MGDPLKRQAKLRLYTVVQNVQQMPLFLYFVPRHFLRLIEINF